MDSPLLSLLIGVYLGFFVVFVESQGNVSPPPPPPPPPPVTPPPPPPPLLSPPPPPPFPPPPPRKSLRPQPPEYGGVRSPPPKTEKLNTGEKVGLMFIGVATILQVCVVSYLLISRRQLLKLKMSIEGIRNLHLQNYNLNLMDGLRFEILYWT